MHHDDDQLVPSKNPNQQDKIEQINSVIRPTASGYSEVSVELPEVKMRALGPAWLVAFFGVLALIALVFVL